MKSIGQSCSALCTSSLQDLSAVGSSHSLSEAVFDLSLALFRLVCSLHAVAPPSKIGILSICCNFGLFEADCRIPMDLHHTTLYIIHFFGVSCQEFFEIFLEIFKIFFGNLRIFRQGFCFFRLPIFSAYCFAACSVLLSPNS